MLSDLLYNIAVSRYVRGVTQHHFPVHPDIQLFRQLQAQVYHVPSGAVRPAIPFFLETPHLNTVDTAFPGIIETMAL